MGASESYQAGKLAEAIEAQIREVKAHPTDQGARVFLFELLAFSGDLDRARRQIEAVRYDDPGLDMAVMTYRLLLEAENARSKFFEGGPSPKFLAEPPAHVRRRLEAVADLREGRLAEAGRKLDESNAEAPAIVGSLNGQRFEGIRDADDLFGTVLEVLVKGEYYWIPLEQIDSLAMNPPSTPRDLIWFPARVEMQGSNGEVFLSALYPGSSGQDDDALKLGRGTDWKSPEEGPVLGLGSRLFAVGDGDVSIYEWREFRAEG